MVIQETSGEVKISGALEQKEFKVKTDDGKMFHILSNLYSNPLGAVVRELSTNCNDGHKISGCEDRPFDIILPGRMDMGNFIKFRDYGPGMPHDVVMTIFTTFGESTKSDSNVETGCLGLGSKSPLAITDSFTVTSINDGHKTVYTVSKDSHKRPMLTMFGSNETDEENGLLITVPLTDHYSANVQNEISEQLKYFKVKPRIMKGDKEIDWSWENNDSYVKVTDQIFITRKTRNVDSNIIQGEVGYSFSPSILKRSLKVNPAIPYLKNKGLDVSEDTMDMLSRFFDSFNFKIFMPMGSVSFAPSREELIYDDVTSQNILAQFLEAISYINVAYIDIYKKVECDYQMRKIKGDPKLAFEENGYTDDQLKFLNYVGFSFASATGATLKMKNGKVSRDRLPRLDKLTYIEDILEMKTVDPSYHEVKMHTMIRKTKRWSNSRKYNLESENIYNYIDINDYKNIKIVFVNMDTKFYRKHLTNYMLSHIEDRKNITGYCGLPSVFYVKLDQVTQAHIDEMVDKCGLTPENVLPFLDVLKVSQAFIDSGKAPAKLVVAKPKTLRKVYSDRMVSNINGWPMFETNTTDIKDVLEGCYIETFNNTITDEQIDKVSGLREKLDNVFNSSFTNISHVTDIIRLLNLLGADIPKVNIYAGHAKNFKKTKLVSFFEMLGDKIDNLKERNGVSSLNYTTKTYDIALRKTTDTQAFFEKLDLMHGAIQMILKNNEISEKLLLREYHLAAKFALEKLKKPVECFYLSDHEIIRLYKQEMVNEQGNVDLRAALMRCSLLPSNSGLKKFEEALDIKFNITDSNKAVRDIVDKYNIHAMYKSFDYTYHYYSNLDATGIINMFKSIYTTINKKDYLDENFPLIKELMIKDLDPVLDNDEDEMDTAINIHDSFEAVAE